jgi:hypothetical protein
LISWEFFGFKRGVGFLTNASLIPESPTTKKRADAFPVKLTAGIALQNSRAIGSGAFCRTFREA